MGLARLDEFLRHHQRIGFDTNVFIYAAEDHSKYGELAYQALLWLERAGHSGVTSTLTMTEALTQPYAKEQHREIERYRRLLSQYPHLDWVAPDLEIADLAARFRAEYRMRTPDAIQAATAVRSGARGFISNDPIFKRVESLDVIVLDELL